MRYNLDQIGRRDPLGPAGRAAFGDNDQGRVDPMPDEKVLYICHTCCRLFEQFPDSHEHGDVIECEIGDLGDERRKPLVDENGHIMTRAPRWYLEAIGVIKSK